MKKASLEMLRMLVDESPLAIIAIDSKGKVLHWNLTAETILGFPADEVIGKTLSHLIVPADKLEEDEAIYENARRGDVIRTHVTLRKTKDGSLLCVNLSTRAKFDKRGQIECFVINIMDVTQLKVMQDPDLKLLEEQLRERQRDLEQKIEEVYRFSYAIAHDLRGSIRHIKGFAEIIDEEKEALPAQVIGYPGRIIKSAGEMNQLLDDIYELSRLTHGKLRVRKVNLTGIAQHIIMHLHEDSRGRQIVCEVAPGMVVDGDENMLKIVYNNLIRNAWKFTRKKKTPRIEVGMIERGGIPVYFVRDNGAGFDMQYVNKLFIAFERLHNAAEFEGTGVGLCLVRRIVEMHGGTITAEAEVDKGATFWFTIPKQKANSVTSA